jgi:CO/xanthine dehydrogenase FAD-binding subunit
MNLNTVTELVRPRRPEDVPTWKAGDAWLAGGTWLFSEPQPQLRRLIDLESLGWRAINIDERGLQLAATCTIAMLDSVSLPTDWTAAPLIGQCCRALMASFKVWNTATVGGNICMALPAGAMISLASALDGIATIWTNDGSERSIPIVEFVTGEQKNILAAGDVLRQIALPASALVNRTAFRQHSLTALGRSAALLIGTLSIRDKAFDLTVTAATSRPVRISFPHLPMADQLRDRIEQQIPNSGYLDDVHGRWAWRKHMTLLLAEEIRLELCGDASQ